MFGEINAVYEAEKFPIEKEMKSRKVEEDSQLEYQQ